MDINDVRGLGTIFAMVAFLGVVWWAYSATRKDRFEQDGLMPFLDDDAAPRKSAEKHENE